jgi:hypothetical protein
MLVRPTAVRVRRFIDWEVGARTPERIWLQAFSGDRLCRWRLAIGRGNDKENPAAYGATD